MPVEHSAGAVIFRKEEGGEIYFLLLRYRSESKKEYWGFSKGHVERGEGSEETARREIKEETGLGDIKFIKEFKEQEKYFFTREGKKVYKTVTFLLAETGTKNITISSEHLDSKWLPYKEALARLTFKNAKEILKKANSFLPGKSI
jgi:8-oxo-dGTP pyrophosphatase MutT (NUDIX family)